MDPKNYYQPKPAGREAVKHSVPCRFNDSELTLEFVDKNAHVRRQMLGDLLVTFYFPEEKMTQVEVPYGVVKVALKHLHERKRAGADRLGYACYSASETGVFVQSEDYAPHPAASKFVHTRTIGHLGHVKVLAQVGTSFDVVRLKDRSLCAVFSRGAHCVPLTYEELSTFVILVDEAVAAEAEEEEPAAEDTGVFLGEHDGATLFCDTCHEPVCSNELHRCEGPPPPRRSIVILEVNHVIDVSDLRWGDVNDPNARVRVMGTVVATRPPTTP